MAFKKNKIALSIITSIGMGLAGGIGLTGCASQQVANSEAILSEASQAASSSQTSAQETIQRAKTALSKATESGLNYYSPLHIKNAKEQLSLAEAYLTNPPKDKPHAALTAALATNSLLQKALDNETQVKANFKELFNNKTILDELGAKEFDKSTYRNITKELEEIISSFEAGENQDAIARAETIITQMRNLEIRFLLYKHVEPAKQYLEKALDIEADEYAPNAFEKAQREIAKAEEFVRKNNRNLIGVERAGKQATLAVQRCYVTAQDSKPLVNMLPKKAEQHVMEVNRYLTKLIKQISPEDTNPPIQISELVKRTELKLSTLSSDNERLAQELRDSKLKVRELNNQLEVERAKESAMLEDASWLTPNTEDNSSNDDYGYFDDTDTDVSDMSDDETIEMSDEE